MLNNDTKTTILGLAAGALLAAGIDWGKFFVGDHAEWSRAAGAVIVGLLGYWTNKAK